MMARMRPATTWKLVRHIAMAVLRVLLLAAPIAIALAALTMSHDPDRDRPAMPDRIVPGATDPTGN